MSTTTCYTAFHLQTDSRRQETRGVERKSAEGRVEGESDATARKRARRCHRPK